MLAVQPDLICPKNMPCSTLQHHSLTGTSFCKAAADDDDCIAAAWCQASTTQLQKICVQGAGRTPTAVLILLFLQHVEAQRGVALPVVNAAASRSNGSTGVH